MKTMIGCPSQGQGSSTRLTTRTRSWTRPSRVPKHCGCGCRPVLRWSKTNTNPDKPFFGCPNYNTRGKTWCEFFLWADDVEEEEEHEGRVDATAVDNEQVRVNLAWRIGKLEAEVRTQKCMIQFLGIVVLFIVVVVLVMTLKF
ncbi:hypothetical protein Ahy_B08g093310 [Arachis hypogaea]|uniref:GRF-type domain-containing protein n=1 Tax=Arachis hypogaea TaxID=3818 RepID=A0A444Y5U0_ARAHY|nr:uncharacterized protein LOC112769595 [Arachis hypogaea]RYQ97277.1 hypothetical protein Ahy_B08g093310 [Arachis hypogaea]